MEGRYVGQSFSRTQPSDGMIGRILDSMVAQVLNFDRSGVLVFHKSGNPVVIYDNFSDIVDQAHLERFLQSSYILCPVYQAFLDGDMPHVSTARELAARNPVHKELPYLLSLHISLKPNVLADEAYISLTKGSLCICYAAIRRTGSERYSEEDIGRVEQVAPKVIELLDHFSNLIALPQDMDGMLALRANLYPEREAVGSALQEEAAPAPILESVDIDDVFKDKLSPREQASISMTLQGNSVDHIAYALNISPHTVRVHMRNAYAKLQVRNRLELFAMFLRQAGFQGRADGSARAPRVYQQG